MSVTAKDIARELQLSQPTVSRILSGDASHRASEETRRRVNEAARRLGYRANAVASSLRRGRTGLIGLHTNHNYDARNEFFGSIIGGLQCACNARGLDLLLHSALHGRSASEMFDRLRDGRVDGLILHSSSDDPLVAMLSESSLPVVSVADSLPGMASVTCDDAAGMKALLDYLWGRGYRRFVFAAPTLKLPSVETRGEVFARELKKRRLPASARRVTHIAFEDAAPLLGEVRGEPGEAGGGPTVVCCWNDRTAYNLLHECARRGVRVPQDLAVAGFDGFRCDKAPAQQLVSVGCPWPDVASRALSLLAEQIEAGAGAPSADEICLPVTLLEGDTA
jgi:DNA-binding LacI/PurR family transcriptional regulator